MMSLRFVAVLSLIFILGCVSSGSTSSDTLTKAGGSGIVIDEFSTDFGTIDAGDSVTLLVKLKNVDTLPAKDISVQLFSTGLENNGKTIESITELEPNGTDFVEFVVSAPSNLRIDRTYTPYVQMCYGYSSVATNGLFVISEDIYDRETTVPDITTDQAPGPLKVNIDFGSVNILRISSFAKKKTVSIEISNNDVGRVVNGTEDFEDNIFGSDGKLDYIKKGGVLIYFPPTQFATGKIIDTRGDLKCISAKSDETKTADDILNGDLNGDSNDSNSNENTNDDSNNGNSNDDNSNENTNDDSNNSNSNDDNSNENTNGDSNNGNSITANVILSGDSNENAVFNSTHGVYCTNKEALKFSSSGKTSRITMTVEFNISESQQDVVSAVVDLDYRYCITSDQLRIVAKKLV